LEARKVKVWLGIAAALAVAGGGLAFALHEPVIAMYHAAVPPEVRFGVGDVDVGAYRVRVEIASTENARQQGLMNRTSLGSMQGMLFVFDSLERQCMWMKNTKLALSVAFIDAGGHIINVEDMLPETETPHCSTPGSNPSYALEMASGWFRERRLGAGTPVSSLPAVRVAAPGFNERGNHAND